MKNIKKSKELKPKNSPVKKVGDKKKEKITGGMTISEVAQKYPQVVEVFFDYGLFCVGCAASEVETIEQGAEVHGINVEHFLHDLNKKL